MTQTKAGVLALFLVVGALGTPAQAQGKSRAKAGTTTGGVGLMLGAGFLFDREADLFRMGPKGWLWLSHSDRLSLGLALPLAVGISSRERNRVRNSWTVWEIAPSVKGALTLSPLLRPYAEFGMGTAVVTHRWGDTRWEIWQYSSTQASFLVRTAVGVDLTPPKLEGLVFSWEVLAVHARIAGFAGGEVVMLVGVGYEF